MEGGKVYVLKLYMGKGGQFWVERKERIKGKPTVAGSPRQGCLGPTMAQHSFPLSWLSMGLNSPHFWLHLAAPRRNQFLPAGRVGKSRASEQDMGLAWCWSCGLHCIRPEAGWATGCPGEWDGVEHGGQGYGRRAGWACLERYIIWVPYT